MSHKFRILHLQLTTSILLPSCRVYKANPCIIMMQRLTNLIACVNSQLCSVLIASTTFKQFALPFGCFFGFSFWLNLPCFTVFDPCFNYNWNYVFLNFLIKSYFEWIWNHFQSYSFIYFLYQLSYTEQWGAWSLSQAQGGGLLLLLFTFTFMAWIHDMKVRT